MAEGREHSQLMRYLRSTPICDTSPRNHSYRGVSRGGMGRSLRRCHRRDTIGSDVSSWDLRWREMKDSHSGSCENDARSQTSSFDEPRVEVLYDRGVQDRPSRPLYETVQEDQVPNLCCPTCCEHCQTENYGGTEENRLGVLWVSPEPVDDEDSKGKDSS